MKEAIENWLDQIPAWPGLLALGVRFSDHQCMSRSRSDAFPLPNLETIWHYLAETVASFNQHRIAATRMRWAYDRSQLHYVARIDGVSLGLFVTVDAEAEAVEQIVGEFLELGA